MTLSKILIRMSLGFVFALIALGLLPFLVIFSWAELLGVSELYTSPLLLIQRLYRDPDRAHNQNRSDP